MKTFYFALFFLSTISITLAQWVQQHPYPQSNDLHSVKFISPTVGWAVGLLGTIIKTTDGGTTWTPQTSGTTITLNSVSFTDANNGCAVGEGGTILRTTNGGTTWSPQTSGTTNDLLDVTFPDANNGWAVGQLGTIIRTTDGGTTWTPQTSGTTNSFSGVSFVDANNGWAVGSNGTIIRTTNKGTTWTQQTSGTTNDLYDVRFTDANNGWVVGGGWGNGMILNTTNGGLTWTSQITNLWYNLNGVSFTDANNGIVVGGNEYSYQILRTTDGGSTWTGTEQSSQLKFYLNGVSFVDANNGWAVGYGGIILRTTDGGLTWKSNIVVLDGIRSVYFLDVNNGWAVGSDGYDGWELFLLKTNNGGITWTKSAETSGESGLDDVFFVDANNGWAVGSSDQGSGFVVRTNDGGTTWAGQWIGYRRRLTGIYFIDSNNGWIVGELGWESENAEILFTSNGGTTWIDQTSGTRNDLLGVCFTDFNNGTAVGWNGTILVTTDGGTTWILQTSGTTNDLYDVCFPDANNGWVVGAGGTILRTTDGGTTWLEQTSGTTNGLRDVCFPDVNNGWAVGAGGTILRTTNGGINWALEPSGTTTTLESVSFPNANNGWAVGGNTILKYSGTTAIVTLTSPNGGEWWKTGWTREITWSSSDVSNVNLYYSSDGGTGWNTIATNIDASTGSYSWEIPLLNPFILPFCKVKVEDASNASVFDESNNNFIIWHPWGAVGTCNLGQQIVDFLATNVDISLNVTTAGNITVTYYPGEAAVEGTLPSGVLVISDYFWEVTTPSVSFNNGKMIIPISTLRGVTDATKLVWLKRSNSGDPWENIGGIVSGENLESVVSFNSFSEFAIGSTDPANPLPVELSSFTATSKPDQVILKWETKTETNNYGFDIERKVSDQWQKIGFINGNGNSNSPKSYSYSDENPIGGSKFQYRLKQIDNDGQYEYSKAVEVELIPNEYALYQNYPNPFNPTTKIRYQLPVESKVVIKIYNILGSEVMELLNEQKEAGIYEVEFNAETLSSGTYIYKLSADNFVQTKKMILLK